MVGYLGLLSALAPGVGGKYLDINRIHRDGARRRRWPSASQPPPRSPVCAMNMGFGRSGMLVSFASMLALAWVDIWRGYFRSPR